MKSLIIILLASVLSCSSLYSQSEYVLDSSRLNFTLLPSFSFFETNKFFYDDQNRLIRKNYWGNVEGYTTYEYFDDRIVESVFNDIISSPLSNQWDKAIRYLNDDGFEIKVEYFNGPLLVQKDSIILDDKNRMREKFEYSRIAFSSNTILSRYSQHDYVDDQVVYQLEESYSSSDLSFSSESEYIYNDNNLLEEHSENVFYFGFGDFSNTRNYKYRGDRIEEVKLKTVGIDGQETNSIQKYTYFFPNILVERFVVIDGNELPSIIDEIKQSKSVFFEYDSIQSFHQGILVNELVNSEKYLEEKELLRIRSLDKSFIFFDQSLNRFILDEKFYRVVEQIGEQESSQENFSLFPNPASCNELVIIQLENPDIIFNQIVMYNEMGQVVSRIPVNGSRYIQFRVPQLSQGIYFVRLQNGAIPVTKLKKMMVW